MLLLEEFFILQLSKQVQRGETAKRVKDSNA